MIYNVVLVAAIQQSKNLVVRVYPFFFKSFSTVVYHKILNIIPGIGPCLSIQYIIVCFC